MTVLVTLPGLDGSPFLQGALPQALQALPGMGDVQSRCIAYPPRQRMGYLELARWVAPQLPQDEPFVLLGESFGGPLALILAGCGRGDAAMQPPPQLQGLVLAASFADCAVPWAAPALPVIKNAPPSALYAVRPAVWAWWLLGRWATPALMTALAQALRHSAPAVLQHRAAQALQPPALDLSALAVPLLVLRAGHDRLIAPRRVQALQAAPQCQIHTVPGPHMLLQTQADACAPLVAAFLQGLHDNLDKNSCYRASGKR